jgi:hypothetical protein
MLLQEVLLQKSQKYLDFASETQNFPTHPVLAVLVCVYPHKVIAKHWTNFGNVKGWGHQGKPAHLQAKPMTKRSICLH